jgi:endonuclease YncB( thermonuclease family)
MAVVAQAAEPSTNPCGDPTLVNQAYESYSATVRDVIDPVTVLVAVDNRSPEFASLPECATSPCRVRLVNLVSPTSATEAARGKRHLAELCMSKAVSLSISPLQDHSGVVNALVHVGEVLLNEAQLESGSTRYRSIGPYAVDWFVECTLKRAQEHAREARRGLWATQ